MAKRAGKDKTRFRVGETENAPARRSSLRGLMTLAVAGGVLFASFISGLVSDPPEISVAERRYLKTAPELSVKGILAKEYMKGYEDYLADSFYGRDYFRALKAFAVLGLFHMSDNEGLYLDRSVGAGRLVRVNADDIRKSAKKLAAASSLFAQADCRIYFAVVPDKSLYAQSALPGSGIREAVRAITDETGSGTAVIDLSEVMTGDMYYRGDLHWDQSRISPVVSLLATRMGFAYNPGSFAQKILGAFRGVYSGQLAYGVPDDTMTVMEPDFGVRTAYLNEKTLEMEEGEMYDTGALSGIDPYSVFLSGPRAVVRLENADASGEKTLFLLRDSFGSSIAPLLSGSYRTIVLIDLRYVSLSLLPELLDIPPGSDVLFLYSAQILTSPEVLLVHLK